MCRNFSMRAGSGLAIALVVGRACCAPIVAFVALTAPPAAVPVCSALAGGQFTYEVRRGDSLARVSARFGVEAGTLARLNGLGPRAILRPMQQLTIDNRHLVCESAVALVINVGQRRLFSFDEARRLRASYPAGVGRPDWRTPVGRFAVLLKEENPVWDVPVSIQDEMQRRGEPVLKTVPPGPSNPLGRFWIGLSSDAIGIHGTIAPASVHHCSTHGCIRLHPDDIAELYAHVAVGDAGEIVYEPVLLGVFEDRVLLEAHPDTYGQRLDAIGRLRAAAAQVSMGERIDWDAVARVLRPRDGLLHDVTRSGNDENARHAGSGGPRPRAAGRTPP
jgi:L,D-transpeptidase ErfK/SrfK